MSASEYKFPDDKEGKKMQRSVASLQARVNIPVLDMFCSALEQLTHPELVWKDMMESDLQAMMDRAISQRDSKVLASIWKEIKSKLLEVFDMIS